MGMYTEIFFRAQLVKDLPEEVLSALHAIVGGEDPTLPAPEHPLFDCPRWTWLGNTSSAYFPMMAKSNLRQNDYNKQWNLVLHANLKNYADEIGKFFDWIDPYVDALGGEFIGYQLYEDVEPGTTPIHYFKKESE